MIQGVNENDLGRAINLGFVASVDGIRGWRFCKQNRHIWRISEGWQSADLDAENYYHNHQAFNNLADALERQL